MDSQKLVKINTSNDSNVPAQTSLQKDNDLNLEPFKELIAEYDSLNEMSQEFGEAVILLATELSLHKSDLIHEILSPLQRYHKMLSELAKKN